MTESFFFIAHVHGRFGGYSRQMELARGAAMQGHRVVWAGPLQARAEIEELGNVRFIEAYTPGFHIPLLTNLTRSLVTFLRNADIVKRSTLLLFTEIDVLALWVASPFLSPMKSVFMQRSDLIHQYQFLSGITGSKAMRFRASALKIIFKLTHSKLDQIVVQTPALQARLVKLGVRTPISTVVNNCNPSWSESEKGAPRIISLGKQATHFLVIANFFYFIKGFDILFAAIAELKEREDFRVHVIGGGRDQDLIRSELDRRNLRKHVQLKGRLENAGQYIKEYDVIVIPSALDACPNVLLESITAKVPIIATDIEAHRYLLRDKIPMCAPDSANLSAHMKRFLESDAAQRQEFIPKNLSDRYIFDWPAAILDEIRGNISNP